MLWPPNVPSTGFQPHPQISPYYQPNVQSDTTYNDDGLWFRELIFKNREYFFSAEYLAVRFREPGNAFVGSTPAPVRTAGTRSFEGILVDSRGLGGPGDMGAVQPPDPNRITVGPGTDPFVFLFQNPGDPGRTATADAAIFPIRTLDLFDNPLKANGVRGRWGYFNDDGSGLMLTGWWGFEEMDRFKMGRDAYNGIPITQTFILVNTPNNGVAPVFPRNGGLPLDHDFPNAIEELVGFTGTTQKFDVLFQLEVETKAGGGNLSLYNAPLFKRDWLSVRATWGARYLYVNERFGFRGIDSNLHYTVDAPTTPGGTGVGLNGSFTWRPIGNTVSPPLVTILGVLIIPPGFDEVFEAFLESETDSHLAGPEAGFRYDLGPDSKHFRIWGQSMFGLLANHEKVQVYGNNIGDALQVFIETGGALNMLTSDATFEDTEEHTHASPMFEQSVFVEADLLRYVPVINKLSCFDGATFRAGYTYLVVGDMARPGESISWRGYPDFPSVSVDYHTWSTHNWSFAVDWRY